MGCLAGHSVLVSLGLVSPLVGAMSVPSTQTLYLPGALVTPHLWTDGAVFASSQEMPW